MIRQGLLTDKKREGICFVVVVFLEMLVQREFVKDKTRNVADKTLFECLYHVVVECFPP